jgi:hypothetical protein
MAPNNIIQACLLAKFYVIDINAIMLCLPTVVTSWIFSEHVYVKTIISGGQCASCRVTNTRTYDFNKLLSVPGHNLYSHSVISIIFCSANNVTVTAADPSYEMTAGVQEVRHDLLLIKFINSY